MTDAQLLHSVLQDPLFSKLYASRRHFARSVNQHYEKFGTLSASQRRAIQEVREHLDAWHIGATGLNTEGKYLYKHRAPRRWGMKNRRNPAAKGNGSRRRT